jgi:hypothetical protein
VIQCHEGALLVCGGVSLLCRSFLVLAGLHFQNARLVIPCGAGVAVVLPAVEGL